MPTIEVFLMFGPKDRNSHDGKLEAGPNWTAIKAELSKRGYTLKVNTPLPFIPTMGQIRAALDSAEVVLFVGHGDRETDLPGKFVSTQMKFTDGFIRSPDGAFTGQWNSTDGRLDYRQSVGKPFINNVAAIFTCNSTDQMPNAFDLAPGSHLVTNDGGKDGLTRIGTLELGAAEFVRWYAITKGDVQRSMAAAQSVFVQKGTEWAKDRGDTLSDHVGVYPPQSRIGLDARPHPTCEVRDW